MHDLSPALHNPFFAADPITTGHLKVACEIIHTKKADEVWIVPCGVRPDKPSLRTPYMHRMLMCHLAVNTTFGSSFPIRVCDIEGAELEALATYHLMQRLRAEYPSKDFVFVIGADLLEQLKSWTAPGVPDAGERLWNECNFLLMERPGYEVPTDLPSNFELLTGGANASIVTEDTSSSEIRRARAAPPNRRSHPHSPSFSLTLALTPKAHSLARSPSLSRSSGVNATLGFLCCLQVGFSPLGSGSTLPWRSAACCRRATGAWLTGSSRPPSWRTSSATSSVRGCHASNRPRVHRLLRVRNSTLRLTRQSPPLLASPHATRRCDSPTSSRGGAGQLVTHVGSGEQAHVKTQRWIGWRGRWHATRTQASAVRRVHMVYRVITSA